MPQLCHTYTLGTLLHYAPLPSLTNTAELHAEVVLAARGMVSTQRTFQKPLWGGAWTSGVPSLPNQVLG